MFLSALKRKLKMCIMCAVDVHKNDVFVCVCVCEREREREGERASRREETRLDACNATVSLGFVICPRRLTQEELPV